MIFLSENGKQVVYDALAQFRKMADNIKYQKAVVLRVLADSEMTPAELNIPDGTEMVLVMMTKCEFNELLRAADLCIER